MTLALLSRSRKPVPLFTALMAALTGLAVTAGPAMALSLNPEAGSPGVGKANTLHWILLILIVIAVVVVNLAILRAVRSRSRHVPATESRGPGQFTLGIGLGVIALAIFITATIFSDQSRQVPVSTETVAELTEGEPLPIRATGQQWLWRFDYPNSSFSYRRLTVPTGVTVALNLTSIDVIHGWNVPSLTAKAQAVPGQTNTVYFRADREGIHKGRSSVHSGQGYATMEIEVDAVSPQEYETFIDQQKTALQDAQDAVEKENVSTDAK